MIDKAIKVMKNELENSKCNNNDELIEVYEYIITLLMSQRFYEYCAKDIDGLFQHDREDWLEDIIKDIRKGFDKGN